MGSYKIDDSIVFKRVDEFLANVDIKYLEEAKERLIKEGKETDIIDKAILERKRRDKKIKMKKSESKKSGIGKAILMSLLFGNNSSSKDTSSDKTLMPWEEDAIKNEDYEPHNFEEEELEEDDYYYDDDN